jgi:RNA polymerase sigma factor (sigma-70 family)
MGEAMPAGPAITDRAARLRELVECTLRDHESALVHYTAGLLGGDWDRARDVVQDAFLKLCRQDPDEVAERVRPWLFTVCRNRAYDLLRRDNRWATDPEALDRLVQPEADPAEESARRDRGREVMDCLAKLPASQQDVVRLRFQQSLSYKEISDITGMSMGNVGFLLHTAMKKLRALLEMRQQAEARQGGAP